MRAIIIATKRFIYFLLNFISFFGIMRMPVQIIIYPSRSV